MKTFFHVVNETEQRKVICNHLRLIPLDELQTVFRLSPSLISHFHRFRRAAESDSFPPGDAKGACTNSPMSWQNVNTRRTPQPLRRQLPFQGRLGVGLCEFALVHFKWYSAYRA